jgi:hypothetical protein
MFVNLWHSMIESQNLSVSPYLSIAMIASYGLQAAANARQAAKTAKAATSNTDSIEGSSF